MLSDVEDLATDAAMYYNVNEDHKVATAFYEKVLYARKQIQRGIVFMKFKFASAFIF